MDSNGNNFPFRFLATAFFGALVKLQAVIFSLQLLSFCVKAIIIAIILFSHYERRSSKENSGGCPAPELDRFVFSDLANLI